MHCSCVTGKPRHEGVTSPGGKASTQRLAQWSWGQRKASSSDSQRPELRGRTAGTRQDPGTPRLAHPAGHICHGPFQQVPSGRRAAPALGVQRCLVPSWSCRCQWGQCGSRAAHTPGIPALLAPIPPPGCLWVEGPHFDPKGPDGMLVGAWFSRTQDRLWSPHMVSSWPPRHHRWGCGHSLLVTGVREAEPGGRRRSGPHAMAGPAQAAGDRLTPCIGTALPSGMGTTPRSPHHAPSQAFLLWLLLEASVPGEALVLQIRNWVQERS